MEIAGYQSDIKTTSIFNQDKYHAEKSVAEFGITTGAKANTYELSLTPKLTKAYTKGLRIQVQFHKTNTGSITLNIDDMGAVAVMRFVPVCTDDNGTETISDQARSAVSKSIAKSVTGQADTLKMETLVAGNINTSVHYILVFDGQVFQMINHIPECPSKATVIVPPPPSPENKLFFNRQELMTIEKDHVDPRISVNVGRNRYAAINGNLIVARDIRIKRTGGPGQLFGARIKLPKPLDPSAAYTPGALQSLEGKTYFYDMSKDGVIHIQGELFGVNDEINVNFYPYIAKYPLEWDTKIDFSQITVAKSEIAPKSLTKTKPSSKRKNAK